MTATLAHQPPGTILVRRWLVVVAVMVAAMVVLGGATRLTDSGLSITEWRPVTGLIPPLSEEAWIDEFIKYQGIPEYQIINQGMAIDEFKTIYWWEWSHRTFGRLIAVVFALPLVWFLFRRMVDRRLAIRLTVILALGMLQGFVGWFMVQSGLDEGVDVSHYRLAAHLGLAILILGVILWTIFDLAAPADERPKARLPTMPAVLLGLVFLQILAGALVAGLDAGRTYNSWPLMDGALIPDGLLAVEPWYLNLFENVLTVQFNHRILAYLLLALAGWHLAAVRARDCSDEVAAAARLLFAAVMVQIVLGIAALLFEVPLSLGLVHQAGALVVFAAALRHLHVARRLMPERAVTPSPVPDPGRR